MSINLTAVMGTIAGFALLVFTIKLAHDGCPVGAVLSGIVGVGFFGLGVGNIGNDNIR
jgi:hypothetical protein